jgi:hypothetical protein
MKRSTLAALAAACLFSTTALAGTPADLKTEKLERRSAATHYANAAERWRGRPAQRAALAHPADEASPSEKVYELLPSANFMLEGQAGGAFVALKF